MVERFTPGAQAQRDGLRVFAAAYPRGGVTTSRSSEKGNSMRPVYVVSGGVSKFAKARPDVTFQPMVKEAFDYALRDLDLPFGKAFELIDGSVAFYFSDHFQRQLMSGIMAQDYLGLCPKPSHRDVLLLPHEKPTDYTGLMYPGIHSFRAGRTAAKLAYQMAGVLNPVGELDFIELHDAYTSSEIQTYEDLGLCRYGEGGGRAEEGPPSWPNSTTASSSRSPGPSR